jgi:hypothetical protein
VSQPKTKVERLVRLNRFREDLASGQVQRALARQSEAKEATQLADAIVDAIGIWKSGHLAAQPDLGLYEAVLGMEARAVARAQAEQVTLAECSTRTDATRRDLRDARSATRASDRRHQRLADAAQSQEEKREFDHTSDAWLANRGDRQ